MTTKGLLQIIKFLETDSTIEDKIFNYKSIDKKYFGSIYSIDEIIQEVNEFILNGNDGRQIYDFVMKQLMKAIIQKKSNNSKFINKTEQVFLLTYNEESNPLDLIKILKKYGY